MTARKAWLKIGAARMRDDESAAATVTEERVCLKVSNLVAHDVRDRGAGRSRVMMGRRVADSCSHRPEQIVTADRRPPWHERIHRISPLRRPYAGRLEIRSNHPRRHVLDRALPTCTKAATYLQHSPEVQLAHHTQS
jgi:hypothetical protein